MSTEKPLKRGAYVTNREEARLHLNRTRILRAALALADDGGLEALSMRRIATELDAKAMSLYNHVENKEDIIDGIVDMVVGEIEVPSLEDDWKTAMWKRARSAHEVLQRHPWATMALVSRANVGPNMLRYVNATIGCLREAGFSCPMTDHVWNVMDNHIYGFTLQEFNFPFEASEYSETARAFLEHVPTEKYPYFTELTKLIIDGSHSGVHDFSFGLELILDGLQRYLSDSNNDHGNQED